MQFFSSFEHTVHLEMVISALEEKGIKKEHIFAVPLKSRRKEQQFFDSIHYSDGISFVNKGSILATAFAVIGASRGFVLEWGPIYWGLIGAVSGFFLGLLIDLFIYRVMKKKRPLKRGKTTEIILIIDCEPYEAQLVEHLLWHHQALGVAKVIKA
ncbi:hypothetical protein [Litchfieldia salsa]|uniref:Uncharacterized protein n=1 Tax=Litchfieldia salsa TaxID=930152 RepID=A0A1H0X3W5_9BACI|nr:hypothetical protein [Litchfieldia salsa]SDP97415.1 hypothetical protein SAMN05216565_1292 [Litchfieldia salsa]